MSRHWPVLALGLAILVAVVVRFMDLAINPGGLYTDEAVEALSAHRLLTEPGFHPIFFADGGGREATFAYLVAGAFRLFGESTLTLRATSAALGLLAIPAVWLLGRRFGEGTGLIAAGWAAGSLWLVCISRDGMRNVLVPLLGALALAALLWWRDRPTRGRAILAGGLVAFAALYTYQPLKLLPILVVAWLAWLARVSRPEWERLRSNLIAAAVAFALIAAPMVVVAATDPAAYFGRALGVLPLAPGSESTGLLEHWLRTLGMFAITGDPNQRHDVGQLPLLGWPVFAVALVGLWRLWRERRDPRHALVLLSLPLFLLPPLVAAEGGAPHFLRSLGLAAPLAVTVGLGASQLVCWIGDRWGALPRRAVVAMVVAGLAALAAGSGAAFLSRPVADRYEAYRYDLVAAANLAGPRDAVILDDYDATVIRFLNAGSPAQIVEPGDRIVDPSSFRQVVAMTREDLVTALGLSAGGSITPVARDPRGAPSVWAWRP